MRDSAMGNKRALGAVRSEGTRRLISEAAKLQWKTRYEEMSARIREACSTEEWKKNHAAGAAKAAPARKGVPGKNRGERNGMWNPDRASVGRVGQGFTKLQRRTLLSSSCVKCGSTERLELDHILPIFAGGTNDESNAQTLCRKCNQEKRVSDFAVLRERGEFRKSPNPNWMGNSEPNEDGNILVGATTRGRIFRRPGTRMYSTEVFCDTCGNTLLRAEWQLKRAEKVFCDLHCRIAYERSHNWFFKDGNASTSSPACSLQA